MRVKNCPLSFPCAYYFISQPQLKITGEPAETVSSKKKKCRKSKLAPRATTRPSSVPQDGSRSQKSDDNESSGSSLIIGGDM